jgi:LssY C-terminus
MKTRNDGRMQGDEGDQHETTPRLTESEAEGDATKLVSRRRRLLLRTLKVVVVLVAAWLLLAYLILPALWRHYEHHPALENAPKTTRTSQDIPGDPLNVGLIGTERELIQAILGSGWDVADPVTLRSSIRIAGSVLRDRPYVDAPVSSLFVFGRKQDLAFE